MKVRSLFRCDAYDFLLACLQAYRYTAASSVLDVKNDITFDRSVPVVLEGHSHFEVCLGECLCIKVRNNEYVVNVSIS